ncbi:hypothetical protein Tsubulata_030786 [Turnera subulata]|uniref:Pectinesterase n=1 Tax=Turnera subulata TaxID=218843 RepID=A0A9Q0FJG5_9ROSI|nr:hypothetical protein Tsubulata_030786 [Turnera subulata]
MPSQNHSTSSTLMVAFMMLVTLPMHACNHLAFPTWLGEEERNLLQTPSPTPNIMVAKDGTTKYTTIQSAFDDVPNLRAKEDDRFIIYVKGGTYGEILDMNLANIMLVGEGIGLTIITGNRSVGGGYSTWNSTTFAVSAERFIARGITFQNTAGPQNGMAVALRSGANFSVFYLCGFEGYQDTLNVHIGYQFFRDCEIHGTVDFIFGFATAVIQNSTIYVRKPMEGQPNVITAHGRSTLEDKSGISIQNSRVLASPDLKPVQHLFPTYLGRPWRPYARTVFMETFLDTLINPAGWLAFNGSLGLDTLYYGEYKNTGPGASITGRVKWIGYHAITDPTEASQFTVAKFIQGDAWLPNTSVPYNPGL